MADNSFKAIPSLVIGLGGTGLKVVTFVKKGLLETNRNQLPDGMALLVLDTEQQYQFKVGGWGNERDQHHQTGPVSIEGGEYVPLTGTVRSLGATVKAEQIKAEGNDSLLQNQPNRHISSWFQARYYLDVKNVEPSTWNLNVGAGRLRQFGRLALFTNMTQLNTLLLGSLRAIYQSGASQVYVHITGSLAGGTGAALVADVAHLVHALAPSAGFRTEPVIIGHFVLPEAFRGTPAVQISQPTVRQDFEARSYAALRELTRLDGVTTRQIGGYPMVYDPTKTGPLNSRLQGSPYSVVYLYDGQRERNPLNILELEKGLAPSIADVIVSYVDDRSGSAFCSHSVNYKSFYPAFNIPDGVVTYGSVGTYTIELPIYHIVEGWSHSLAREALDVLLKPKRDEKDVLFPLQLETGQPEGLARDPSRDAESWLKLNTTALVAQLAEWGLVADRTAAQREQVVAAILAEDARGWQQRLAPSDSNWQNYVAQAQEELDGSVNNKQSGKYYVDHNQPGKTNEQQASNMETEVGVKHRQMLGEPREVWLRAGGDFRRALVILGSHHVTSFDDVLLKWLRLTLNGDPNQGTPQTRKQAKLGYALAFLQRVDKILKDAAAVLARAGAESQTKRKPQYDGLELAYKEAATQMRRGAGFQNSNRKKYREAADRLMQFQKADVARQVVYELIERLQKSVEGALKELTTWERALATSYAADGGAYALLLDGQREVQVDRNQSKNAARWVIEDNEEKDEYLSQKREALSRGKLDDVLQSMEWSVVPQEGGGLRVDFKVGGKAWDRRAGASGQQVLGLRNLNTILNQCRAVYDNAWTEMSVTEYLRVNYVHRVGDLGDRVFRNSGYLLKRTSQEEPPMRTTIMRVYKVALKPEDEAFLEDVRREVAVRFKEVAASEIQVAAKQNYLSSSGQESRDRFKLTFVMFGDLLRPTQIEGYADAEPSYHTVSAQGSRWRELHVLPAESNALQIECGLSTGDRTMRQRRRQLSEKVVVTMEDIDRFHLAMRCLAYGSTNYDWKLGGERGILLHRYTPPQDNPRGYSYWRLMVDPEGQRRADGDVYTLRGRAYPVEYPLTPPSNQPSLMEAIVQLVCRQVEFDKTTKIDWKQVEATLERRSQEHRDMLAAQGDMGWSLLPANRRDAQLKAEATDKAARIIRLNGLIDRAQKELQRYSWAWREGAQPPSDMQPEQRAAIQEAVDLWTALRGAAYEELKALEDRFFDLAAWTGEIPTDERQPEPELEITAQADTSKETETVSGVENNGKEDAPVSKWLDDGQWVCPSGHVNQAVKKFCTQCGEPGPLPKQVEECGERLTLVADGKTSVGVSSQTKTPPEPQPERKLEPPAPVRYCEEGHEMPPNAKFCLECGKPERKPEPPKLPEPVAVCENGHEMPPNAKFCPECGAPRRPATPVCENGHEMPPNARFCPECGAPRRQPAVA